MRYGRGKRWRDGFQVSSPVEIDGMRSPKRYGSFSSFTRLVRESCDVLAHARRKKVTNTPKRACGSRPQFSRHRHRKREQTMPSLLEPLMPRYAPLTLVEVELGSVQKSITA